MNQKKIAWFVSTLGYNNKLLYWEPILEGFFREFHNTRILTFGTECPVGSTGRRVEKAVSCFRFKRKLRSGFTKINSIPSPVGFFELTDWRPDLVVASEFGLMTFYAVIYRQIFSKSRLLLLVENDPRFIQGCKKGFFNRVVRQWIGKHADMVLTNNSQGRTYLLEYIGLSEDIVMKACYLTSQLPPLPTSIISRRKHEKLIILYVGRILKNKGLYELILALTILSDCDRGRIEVHIVGDGPYLETLERLSREHKLSETIIFYGKQPYEQLTQYYSSADVFILPTLGDYRALVGFEALSAGLPIIGSCYDGAVSEVVEDGINGFIIDPLRPELISEKIVWFIENRGKLASFSSASQRLAERYSFSTAVANLVHACHACLERSSE